MQLVRFFVGAIVLSISSVSIAVPISGEVINVNEGGTDYSLVRGCDDPFTCSTGPTEGEFSGGQAIDFDLTLSGGSGSLLASGQSFNTTGGLFEILTMELDIDNGEIGGFMEYSFAGEAPSFMRFLPSLASYTFTGGVFTAFLNGLDCGETCNTPLFDRALSFAFTGSTGQVPVSEPMSILLLGVSLLGIGLRARRK